MSAATIENPEQDLRDPADVPMSEKTLDKGFKRNMLIIGAALVIAVVVVMIVILGARSKIAGAQSGVAPTSLSGINSLSGSKPSELTPADTQRLGRVQGRESDEAKIDKKTYIPGELPLSSEVRTPYASNDAPGGLGPRGSTEPQGQMSAADSARETNIKKGVEVQLSALLAKLEAPKAGSAGPYSAPTGATAAAGATGTTGTTGTTGATGAAATGATTAAAAASVAPAPEVLVRGLKFASARLVSPLDTTKTEFVSAEITSGPLSGAYLIGKGKLVNESGVTMDFTRMTFDGEDYVVDVKALDNATSSDSVAADIDRKILSRTILPVLFTTAQAYLSAVAQPGATIVAGGLAATQIVTPAAQGRQAAATGLAAGVGRAGAGFSEQKASAYMPVSSPVNLLFNSPVLKKNTK